MKNKIYTLISIFFLFACSNMDKINPVNPQEDVLNDTESLKSFAQILSKALYNEPELREFVKAEALQRKNLDYEVFYPWVKDVVISDNQTFEEIIRKYDSQKELESIIKTSPLLTILVPDWSWVNAECFSLKSWSTDSADVGVSYTSNHSSHEIFHNGEYAFSMQNGEYSTAPILIVKNNERISYSGLTKSGEQIYSFNRDNYIDLHTEAQTKASSTFETIELDYETTSNTINAMVLYSRVRGAYGKTNGTNVPQRDYIYYGLTPDNNQGSLNTNFYERLYQIKISPTAKGVFDDPLGSTTTATDFKADTVRIVDRTDRLTNEEIAAASWGEGSIELTITIYNGGIPIVKKLSIPFDVAFDVKQIELRTNINWLGAVKSRTYYLVIPSDLDASESVVSKWIPVNYDLFNWDISKYPSEYFVEFYECDSATTTTTEKNFTHTFTYMTNYTINLQDPSGILKIGYSGGNSTTRDQQYSYSETHTRSDDNFGNFIVQYNDKIVLSQTTTSATIKTYNTGYIQAMIIPRYE